MMLLNATGWTLIHFLWQGAIIVMAFAAADSLARRAQARTRYAIASAAMSLMLACAVSTFLYLAATPSSGQPGSSAETIPMMVASGLASSLTLSGPRVDPYLPVNYLPWMVYAWLTGVTVLSTRLVIQWVRLDRCRRQGVRMLDGVWEQRIARIAARLRLTRAVRVYESSIADVPAVIGWLRPVVLVPASALLQLAPGQIEALLAHELAHVRRHDYLVNLLQSCMETLFFYHPGVWWVGRRMREERENCCDDLAVAVCGDPVVYARALADLEHVRNNLPELAMAANGGSLLNRIERLIAPRRASRPIAPAGITVVTLLIAGAFLWAAPQQPSPQKQVSPDPKPAPAANHTPKPSRTNPQAKPTPEASKNQVGYLDQLEQAGYRNLTVDQMISMKIHGVSPEYITEIKSLGWSPTADQLVSFRVHGVNAATLKEMRAMGYSLTPDQAVSARVHGLTSDYVRGWKQQGLKDLGFDSLITLKIHGADPAQLGELKTLGFKDLSADDVVGLRIAGVTPGFIREAQTRGFRDLRLDQLMQLKRLGILGSKEPE